MAMSQEESDRLLELFKALADKTRLKVLGVLAQREATTEDLAGILHLSAGTVSHHLARLAKAGLVNARAESYYAIYRLDPSGLETMAKSLLGKELMASVPAAELESYDQKVLRDFRTRDGKFKTIPAQRKKRSVLLHHITASFKPRTSYPEKKVNEILKRFHDDTATLRRELIAEKLLMRDGGMYWRKE
jgi:predicted transcriptional regulator